MGFINKARGLREFATVSLILTGILGFLFKDAFKEENVVFSNDGPYGAVASQVCEMPGYLAACWDSSSYLGSPTMPANGTFPWISAKYSQLTYTRPQKK